MDTKYEQTPLLKEQDTEVHRPVECLGLTFDTDEARRAYFLRILWEKLKDPEFRKIEGFPRGDDEDILALSDPPYYTACPNPFIDDFIEYYSKPFDHSIPYGREPFAADVSEGKNDPIYNAHTYHTKVPHKAIMRYILHYTNPGDIVFDGFCGTGMTGVAAQMCNTPQVIESLGYKVCEDGTILDENGNPFSKLGSRYALLNDLSPAATFISHNYTTSIEAKEFKRKANRILTNLEKELSWMYLTLHQPNSAQLTEAIEGIKTFGASFFTSQRSKLTWGHINYTVWSDVFVCNECAEEIVLWKAVQEHILKEFIPQVNRLTLVADPDFLLTEEDILQRLRERGFDILLFEDPIAFRFAYESKYRSRWDNGDSSLELVVIAHQEAAKLRLLPYDIFQASRKVSFSLGDIFPNLSYSVIKMLDRRELEHLYRAYIQYTPGKLGDNTTKDFLLSRVFALDAKFIREPSDLLRLLLQKHYRDQHIPQILDQRFIQILHQYGRFEDWPLETILQDREAFFSFLQERWPIFLKHIAMEEDQIVHESPTSYALNYSGSPVIPFDNEDVRVYIDTLFLDGLLQPVAYPQASKLSQQWITVGVRMDLEADRMRRLEGLIRSVENTIPTDEARHQDWFSFAYRWAEMIVLWNEIKGQRQAKLEQQFYSVQKKVDTIFQAWIMKRYGSLYNLPPSPPSMLHHVAHDIAQYLQESAKEKVALIIVDGLAFDQWIILREVFSQQGLDVKFRESMVFAWLPTITSVSRQSIFAGKPPLYYPESIFNTNKEAALWTQFWSDRGVSQIEVAYKKGLGEERSLLEIEEVLSHPKLRVVGFIIDKVDKIVHGMELGTAGMHNQVRQWATQGFMIELINLLIQNHFDIFITSDHGNIEARGRGQVSEGAIADLRGIRARVYSDKVLRMQVKNRFPDAIDWPSSGLPENFLPLLAPDRSAFIPEGNRAVGHGGISIEELVVPYIQVRRTYE